MNQDTLAGPPGLLRAGLTIRANFRTVEGPQIRLVVNHERLIRRKPQKAEQEGFSAPAETCRSSPWLFSETRVR